MTQTTNEATKIIDSTKLKAFSACPRRYMYEYEFGWAPEGHNKHLVFGSAWHEAMEFLLNNGYSPDAVQGAYEAFLTYYRQYYSSLDDIDGEAKGPANAFLALSEYVVRWRHDNFRTVYTEIAGTVPITEDGSKIMAFKIDGIIERQGKLYILEHKTASRRGFEDSHLLGTQVGLYTHALYALKGLLGNLPVGGLIINEAIFYKYGTKASATRISQGGSANDFERISVDMNASRLERWLTTTHYWSDRLYEEKEKLASSAKGCFPMNANSCYAYNSKCPFFDFCLAWDNPLERRDQIPIGFKENWWNPLDEYADGVDKLNKAKEGTNTDLDDYSPTEGDLK